MARPKGQPKLGGRKKGVQNKSTVKAREAIAMFVDNNSHRLEEWLDEVAVDNPAEAFRLFQSVIEYHVPKLARTENQLLDSSGNPTEIPSVEITFIDAAADSKEV